MTKPEASEACTADYGHKDRDGAEEFTGEGGSNSGSDEHLDLHFAFYEFYWGSVMSIDISYNTRGIYHGLDWTNRRKLVMPPAPAAANASCGKDGFCESG